MVPLPHLSPPMWIGQDPFSVSLWASSPGGSGGAKKEDTPPPPEHLRELARRLFIRVWTHCILDSLSEEWTSQFWAQFMQLWEAWKKKIKTSMGCEPVTSRYRCDALTNLAMKPLVFSLRSADVFPVIASQKRRPDDWCWEQVNYVFICSCGRDERWQMYMK